MFKHLPIEKKIALKLYSLNWFDRYRLLKALPKSLKASVKKELKVLYKLKPDVVENEIFDSSENSVNQEIESQLPYSTAMNKAIQKKFCLLSDEEKSHSALFQSINQYNNNLKKSAEL